MRSVKINIVGDRVQGVFFRANIQEKAVSLDIKGYVKNLDNGDIEAVFVGDESDIEEILDFCRSGPRNARVASVEILEDSEVDESRYDNFEIRY